MSEGLAISRNIPDFPPLRLGDTAPGFTARSTQGHVSLSDFRGQWVILFSHPADFTPVCTSEFVAIARASGRFAAAGCQLLGLSVDSLFSHFAWLRMIRDRFDVAVSFPLIEDPTLEIARAYGMVGPDALDASSVRHTCFLDPDGVVRAVTAYPAEVGRSIEEMLRLLAALQRVSRGDALAPAGWQPGDDLLAVPDPDMAGVLRTEGPTDWFYASVPDGAGR